MQVMVDVAYCWNDWKKEDFAMSNRLRKNLAISIILLLALAVSGSAQPAGRIFGSLTDPSGAVIGSATVTATDERRGREQTTISAAAGSYLFVNFRVGSYPITASSPGFKKFRQPG